MVWLACRVPRRIAVLRARSALLERGLDGALRVGALECVLRWHPPPGSHQVSPLWRVDPPLVADRPGCVADRHGALVGGLLIAIDWRRITQRPHFREA